MTTKKKYKLYPLVFGRSEVKDLRGKLERLADKKRVSLHEYILLTLESKTK